MAQEGLKAIRTQEVAHSHCRNRVQSCYTHLLSGFHKVQAKPKGKKISKVSTSRRSVDNRRPIALILIARANSQTREHTKFLEQ
jgi:hypothetical protein